ncbi:MAG: oxaloacetate-decarboxylating malate dehydrogenase, partial [Myxococcaceae bacterium]
MWIPSSREFDIKKDAEGQEYLEVQLEGLALLRVALANKGTAFTLEERELLGLEGLLPPQVNTLEQQVERAWRGLLMTPTPLTRYQFLRALQERQETLFYAVLCKHLRELLPIVYTPTVGDAVKHFSALYQHPRGLTVSPDNVARVHAMVARHPLNDVRMIVATDSSAILGIGDQGCGGMAIPIGKLSLYTAAGGVSPHRTLPVTLDVGTDRTDLLEDPMYLGARQRRLTGDAYLAFIDRFVDAVKQRWPEAIIQWEDLAKGAAFTVLERYRKVVPSFNDDIQGTGAVVLAGALSACRMRGEALTDQRIVIHGAGAGGIGVAWALHQGMMRECLSPEEAYARICVLDSRGLLVDDRPLEPYKRPWAQRRSDIAGWAET